MPAALTVYLDRITRYSLAEARLIDAKAGYSEACAAALRGDPDAPAKAERALVEVREALAELEACAGA